MKQLIFILLSVILFMGCQESNSLEPNLNDLNQISKMSEDLSINPILDGHSKEVQVLCNYCFNPDQEHGGWLSSPKYRYDDAITDGVIIRYLDDVKFFAPSVMEIGGKKTRVFISYTVNRTEKILLNGKVIRGETWGSFKIFKCKDPNSNHLDQNNSLLLFQGKLSGKINFDVTNIKLIGKGENAFYDRNFVASEIQVCTSKNQEFTCYSSQLTGKIQKLIKAE